MVTINHAAWYAPLLADWQLKLSGPKPTAAHFAVVHGWGFRPGLEALHLAMCLRADGCTVRQFCIAGSCGPANNKRGLVIKRGLATVKVTGKPYAFTLTPTAKGLALVKANEAKASAAEVKQAAKAKPATGKAKPRNGAAKPKGTGKPKVAPKVPTAPTPTADPAQVTTERDRAMADAAAGHGDPSTS